MTSALDQSEAGIYVSVGSAIGHQVALQASFNIDLIQKLEIQAALYTTNVHARTTTSVSGDLIAMQ